MLKNLVKISSVWSSEELFETNTPIWSSNLREIIRLRIFAKVFSNLKALLKVGIQIVKVGIFILY